MVELQIATVVITTIVGIFIGVSINSTQAITVCSRAQNNRLSLEGHIF